jgi:hypothetical protein
MSSTWGFFLPKFGITTHDPYVSVEAAWISHQVLTASRVSFNRFTHFTNSSSFLSEMKRTFINFPTVNHNLGSSRVTPSLLGGFTSKSNKCHKDYFAKLKYSSAHKEDSLNPPLSFSHKSQDPHKEGLGRAHKGLGWVYFVGGTSTLQRREGGSFYTCPKKTSHWKLATKNWNIRFWKQEHLVFEN